MRERFIAGLGAVSLVLAAASTSHAVGFNFTFDSDVQGWTRGDFGNGFANIDLVTDGAAVHNVSGSNGFIRGSDHGGYAFHFSPDLGGGHGDLFGNDLTYDFRSSGAGVSNPQVVLMSSTAFLVLERTIPASPGFLSYSHKLDASLPWYYNSSRYHNGGNAVLATNAQIQAVLDDLRHVGISTDIQNGGDLTWTDNVRAVSEPMTVAALGLGVATLLRRRRS